MQRRDSPPSSLPLPKLPTNTDRNELFEAAKLRRLLRLFPPLSLSPFPLPQFLRRLLATLYEKPISRLLAFLSLFFFFFSSPLFFSPERVARSRRRKCAARTELEGLVESPARPFSFLPLPQVCADKKDKFVTSRGFVVLFSFFLGTAL